VLSEGCSITVDKTEARLRVQPSTCGSQGEPLLTIRGFASDLQNDTGKKKSLFYLLEKY